QHGTCLARRRIELILGPVDDGVEEAALTIESLQEIRDGPWIGVDLRAKLLILDDSLQLFFADALCPREREIDAIEASGGIDTECHAAGRLILGVEPIFDLRIEIALLNQPPFQCISDIVGALRVEHAAMPERPSLVHEASRWRR